ncbi:hypothetical protein GE061_010553 [Apolygus lucorum]|uniref:Uncharacterized protein n=1 Tax=Apolygus lucorum TaxID=248454 RepID=A0A8S9XW70_APOLU|nr:hypothetical protein GE061_010553 [Apolygus lucorum]
MPTERKKSFVCFLCANPGAPGQTIQTPTMPIPGEQPEFSQQFNAFLRASTATQTTFTSAWTAMISQMQTQSNLMASMQQQALENQKTMALMQEQITKLTLQATTTQQSDPSGSQPHPTQEPRHKQVKIPAEFLSILDKYPRLNVQSPFSAMNFLGEMGELETTLPDHISFRTQPHVDLIAFFIFSRFNFFVS